MGDETGAGRRAARTWNPHVVALIAGGLLLITAGVQLYRSALTVVYSDLSSRRAGGVAGSGGDPALAHDLVTMQVEWTVGPLLIAFGIASVLAGVVVLAVRFERRLRG